MKKSNFNNYRFRCSQLGKLMVNSRSKKEKLSKTTQTFLTEIYVEEVFGRSYEIHNKFLDKGNYAEEDSLDLLTAVDKKFYVKNKNELSNKYVKGTPDVISPRLIIDIKTKWDLLCFAKENGTNKDYYWQLQGYMDLTKKKRAKLVYTLVNTPEHLIAQEVSREFYRTGVDDGSKEMADLEEKIRHNMTYDDIPQKLRVKKYDFRYNSDDIQKLYERIEIARDYLNNLSL